MAYRSLESFSDWSHSYHSFAFLSHIDWTLECYYWAPTNAPRLEKRGERHHPQPGRSDANDWEKHLPSPAQRQKRQFELCWNRYRPRGRDGPSLASPSGYLRILLTTSDKRICRGSLAESVRDAVVRSRVPRLVRFGGICRKRLSEEHFAQIIRQGKFLVNDEF